ncbi:MAG: ATP-binding protein [Cyanobacteria bacterium J06600_6]
MNQDQILTSDRQQPEPAVKSTEKKPDLAEFTSSMVEDLQAPLRSLTMFTELLTKEYQNDLDEKGQLYLDRISASGSRMQTLVEDLLTYSRTGTGEQTWIKVNLDLTVAQVQYDLKSEIAQSNAKIIVGDLPQLLLNPKEIYQLFKNLIENALKFSNGQPQIEISVTAQGEEWLFAIKDRGIGIAPECHLQVFEVFQRLHADDVYPGSGIGLAICQKIVHRYEGIIWVESRVGKGSTFYFTLPMNICSQSPNAKIV